jgi:putative DNA primase/helicase
MARVELL